MLACDVNVEGFRGFPTLHSLRVTLISKLQQEGHTETQIAKRTGHKYISSQLSYTTTLRQEGLAQQQHIFSAGNSSQRTKLEKGSAIETKVVQNNPTTKVLSC